MGARSVTKFCRDHNISRGTFYNLRKNGKGPRIMKVGNRTLVSDEAVADWRRMTEEESAETRETGLSSPAA